MSPLHLHVTPSFWAGFPPSAFTLGPLVSFFLTAWLPLWSLLQIPPPPSWACSGIAEAPTKPNFQATPPALKTFPLPSFPYSCN